MERCLGGRGIHTFCFACLSTILVLITSLEFISLLIKGAEAPGFGDDIGLKEGSGEEGPEKVPVVLNVAKEGFGDGGMTIAVDMPECFNPEVGAVDCFNAGFRGRGLFLMSIPGDVDGIRFEVEGMGLGKDGVAGFSKEANLTPFDGKGRDFWKM